jgi:queuine tRNA-ribosyltransferase
MRFNLFKKDAKSKARAGCISTFRCKVLTPVFMPVATLGTIKGIDHNMLPDIVKNNILLINAYHLYLRPGLKVIYKSNGMHNFMKWNNLLLSDSGGFQIFSLMQLNKINSLGVYFRSHIDGKLLFLTPRFIMKIQEILGSDIVMPLDICSPKDCTFSEAKEFMDITHKWYKECLERVNNIRDIYYNKHKQVLFPIIQGGFYKKLRLFSVKYLLSTNPQGIAIGGLSVGEKVEMLYDIVNMLTDYIPHHIPRYLMGVGSPVNILECIALGVDMFDCVLPTRNARNGTLYTWNGIINIKNKKWKYNDSALSNLLNQNIVYSKSYIRHLFTSNEILAKQLATIHNLSFYSELLNTARYHILKGDFLQWKDYISPIISSRI